MNDFEDYRGLLFSIAYRMLGSAADAEDLVQDAFVRYASTDRDVVRDVKAFLVTILTRLALDRLKSAQVQREQYIGPWLPEPVFTGSDADPFASAARGEEIQIALLAAMERLTPQERAVLLLSEVLEHDHAEIAEMLGITPAASRQLLHRARERVSAEQQRFQPSMDEKRRLVDSFMSAIQSGKIELLRNVLTADVIARGDGGGKVPGAGMHPIFGLDKVARLFFSIVQRVLPSQEIAIAEVNGSPAIVRYTNGTLDAIVTFAFDGNRIMGIDTIVHPDKLAFAQRQGERASRPQ